MIDEFMATMEDAFGKYRPGMSYGIRQKLCGLTQDSLDMLSDKLIAEYDMNRPPSLKVILSTMHNHNILGSMPITYSCSVCEHCGKDYSSNSLLCPYCKKLRVYGFTKMLKDKPPWYEAELRQMKKDELEIQDIKRG